MMLWNSVHAVVRGGSASGCPARLNGGDGVCSKKSCNNWRVGGSINALDISVESGTVMKLPVVFLILSSRLPSSFKHSVSV